MIIRRATPADREILLDRWLRSVQATHTIDSMFLAPEFMARGVGRQMLRLAQSQWADLTVDVNEQNEAATRFYEACGFVVTGRSEQDEQGRPFPLLHMKLIAPTLVRPPERRA